MLVEVGGKESAQNFNRLLLNDSYHVLHEPSNSDRGIDMCYLLHKRVQANYSLISHRNYQLPNQKFFSRDLLQLNLNWNSQHRISFFLTHLKSKLSKSNDFEGKTQRSAEITGIISLVKAHQEAFPQTPFVLAGDLNSNLDDNTSEPEAHRLKTELGLEDIFNILNVLPEERFTYLHFKHGGKAYASQLDYVLMPCLFAQIVKSAILDRYDAPIPTNFKSKQLLPSDHYPIIFLLNF
jgi:endonuclease/exonuclease/phosphatase family metal-dependent hydrolase